MLAALLSLFFAGAGALGGAVGMAALLGLSLAMTLGVSFLLSKTALKGLPSFFALELPPYRRPQVGQVLVRSVLDRTLRVLGRAAAVAAPAGVLIWCLGNVTWAGESLLTHCARLLEPFARLLLAFLLALPANELVLPLLLMGYLSQGALVEVGELSALHGLLLENGWTWVTALCVLVFTLFHCLLDHLEGDKKPEVDGPVHGFAHGLRPAAVFFDFLRRPPAGLVAFVEGN